MTEPVGTSRPSSPTAPDDQLPPNLSTRSHTPDSPSPTDALPIGAHRLVDEYVARASRGIPSETQDRSARWYRDKALSEGACLLPGDLALRAAKLKMPDGGLAEKMMDHFVSGSAQPVRIDLDAELERNPQLLEYVASRIENEIAERARGGVPVMGMSGAIWVPQSAYGPSDAGTDQQLALGGTYFEYQIVGSAGDGGLEVKLHVADHYFWSPSDTRRPSQCLHERGARLVSEGRATEFYQVGEGSIVVSDPARSEPMTPLDVEPEQEA